ncbi:MAG: hypothetical protein NTNFB02_31780 [Nitrospira sp.]
MNVTGTPALPEPDVAVTVTVDVPAGVPVAGGAPPEVFAGGADESPPLQLNRPASVTVTKQAAARLSMPSIPRRRARRPTGIRPTGAKSQPNIVLEIPEGRRATGPPAVVMVNVVLIGPPAGVIVAGLNEQLAPTGNPPQPKVTG